MRHVKIMSLPEQESPSQPRSNNVSFERERGVFGLRVTRDVAHAVVEVGGESLRAQRALLVFKALAEAEAPVFLVKIHATAITLAFAGTDLALASKILTDAGFKATLRRDLALIAIRAASMRELPGIMSLIGDALFSASAKLMEIGDSHDSVLCLIEAESVAAAVEALCRQFNLLPSDVIEESLIAEAQE